MSRKADQGLRSSRLGHPGGRAIRGESSSRSIHCADGPPEARSIVIFDLDGTLIDSMAPYAALFCEMLWTHCGVPETISLPVYTALAGKGPKAQFAAVLRGMEADDADLVEDLTRRYWQRAEVNEPALFPEVLDVLHRLRAEGITLAVSSGSIPTSVERKLRLVGIQHLFEVALGSDEDVPGLAKGAGHFAMIADVLSVSPSNLVARSVFVGDGVYDMQVACEAGMSAIGRLTGDNGHALLAAGATHLIDDLRSLPPLLA